MNLDPGSQASVMKIKLRGRKNFQSTDKNSQPILPKDFTQKNLYYGEDLETIDYTHYKQP